MFFDTPVSGASTVVALETGVRIDGRVDLGGPFWRARSLDQR